MKKILNWLNTGFRVGLYNGLIPAIVIFGIVAILIYTFVR